MVHVILISLAQLAVGVLAVLAFQSAMKGETDKLRTLFRAVVVLVLVEFVTQIISFFAISSYCHDEAMSSPDGKGIFDKMQCRWAPGGDGGMHADPDSHLLKCEEMHIVADPINSVVVFLIQVRRATPPCFDAFVSPLDDGQVGINCYFCWVLFSFEKELREAGGGTKQQPEPEPEQLPP